MEKIVITILQNTEKLCYENVELNNFIIFKSKIFWTKLIAIKFHCYFCKVYKVTVTRQPATEISLFDNIMKNIVIQKKVPYALGSLSDNLKTQKTCS